MNDSVRAEIDNAVRAITQSMQPLKIYLFGSHANGIATQDSDIDLCVIASLGSMRRAMLPAVSHPVDLLVYDDADFAMRAAVPSTLEHKIAIDGAVLYEQ